MILLNKNTYMEIYRHDNVKAFEQRYLPESANLYGENHLNQMILFKEILLNQLAGGKYFPNLIINTVNGGPTMELNAQEWMHNVFNPFLSENNFTTKAYCLGDEILSKESVRITAEDNSNSTFNFNFFSTLEDGLTWLEAQNLTL